MTDDTTPDDTTPEEPTSSLTPALPSNDGDNLMEVLAIAPADFGDFIEEMGGAIGGAPDPRTFGTEIDEETAQFIDACNLIIEHVRALRLLLKANFPEEILEAISIFMLLRDSVSLPFLTPDDSGTEAITAVSILHRMLTQKSAEEISEAPTGMGLEDVLNHINQTQINLIILCEASARADTISEKSGTKQSQESSVLHGIVSELREPLKVVSAVLQKAGVEPIGPHDYEARIARLATTLSDGIPQLGEGR